MQNAEAAFSLRNKGNPLHTKIPATVVRDALEDEMDKLEALKLELEHMENRTQWHQKDMERVESLRNEVAELEHGGELPDEVREQNKVVHHH